MPLTEDLIRAALNDRPNGPLRNPYPLNVFNRPRRRAAVLIPFTRLDGSWHIVFIRRTAHERDDHGGQVAFPGGGAAGGDDGIESTALREAHEEIGLKPEHVRILGRLDDVISISNYHVTPLVGAFDSPYPLTPDHSEVARVFSIPLNWLADPANRRTETRQVEGHDPWPVVFFERYDGELLWGFTAALTISLLNRLRLH